jgi:hypothetical protein
MKLGYIIFNVGATGTGKSEIIRNLIKEGRKIFVYDLQNEYELPEFRCNQYRFSGKTKSIDDFMCEVVKLEGTGYTIVIEEATGVFSSSRSKEWERLILSKRHDKLTYILNFHTLHKIPPFLFTYADLLILRKTGDFIHDIKKKFPQFLEIVQELEISKNLFDYRIIKLSNLVKNYKK